MDIETIKNHSGSFGNWFFKETNGRDDNNFDFSKKPDYLLKHPELIDQFYPEPELEQLLLERKKQLPKGELIGIHLRRGDFLWGDKYFIPPNEWYKDWLKKVWNKNSVLYVASDDPDIWLDFKAYFPVKMGKLLPEAPFYPDFWMLTQCDKLAISDSTFSFAAAMLNKKADVFMRPGFDKELVEFDPWDSPVTLRLGKYYDKEG